MFPEFAIEKRPDEDIRAEIEDALWNVATLRQSHQPIEVSVVGGKARLSGPVTSEVLHSMALQAARLVPGVTALEDALVNDADLSVAVAQAVAQATGAQGGQIRVVAYKGVVTLAGGDGDAALRRRALAAAAGVPGVRSVVDHLS
ncbi:MAG: BON domain-containing protein [Chloroflexi bacterium]|nr:BON domain-containing protein [Chloroflexota bacterium]